MASTSLAKQSLSAIVGKCIIQETRLRSSAKTCSTRSILEVIPLLLMMISMQYCLKYAQRESLLRCASSFMYISPADLSLSSLLAHCRVLHLYLLLHPRSNRCSGNTLPRSDRTHQHCSVLRRLLFVTSPFSIPDVLLTEQHWQGPLASVAFIDWTKMEHLLRQVTSASSALLLRAVLLLASGMLSCPQLQLLYACPAIGPRTRCRMIAVPSPRLSRWSRQTSRTRSLRGLRTASSDPTNRSCDALPCC